MNIQIRPLTTEDLCALAHQAADQHIPLREANDYDIGSPEWGTFNRAYRAREAQLHLERLVEEVA